VAVPVGVAAGLPAVDGLDCPAGDGGAVVGALPEQPDNPDDPDKRVKHSSRQVQRRPTVPIRRF
jgi:hypothetical protein